MPGKRWCTFGHILPGNNYNRRWGELHGPHDGPPRDHEKRERWGGCTTSYHHHLPFSLPSPRPWAQHQLWPSHQHHHPSLLLALGSHHHYFPVVSVGVGGHVKPKSKREEAEERGDGLVVGGSSTVFTPRKAHRSPSSVLALGNQASRSDPFSF